MIQNVKEKKVYSTVHKVETYPSNINNIRVTGIAIQRYNKNIIPIKNIAGHR